MANGEWNQWLDGLAGILNFPGTLRRCGVSKLDEPTMWEMSVEQESLVAHYMWQLRITLLGSHLTTLLSACWSFPNMATFPSYIFLQAFTN